LAVAKGLYPAGGGIQRTFNKMSPEVRDQLHILWRTEQYTPHAIAAHPRMSREIVFGLQQAMIAMGDEPRGKRLLEGINFTGIEAASDKDWDDVRELEITLLNDLIQE
jgi:phosphonate transport system substrate-binding protein